VSGGDTGLREGGAEPLVWTRWIRAFRRGRDEGKSTVVDKQRDFVLRTIEERGIKFVRLWFTDVVGTLKSVAIAPAEVEGAFAEGIGFDGSAIEGLTRSYEADVLAHPDPATFQVLPWRGEIDPTARMFCDITTPDGQPAAADTRNVLKRALAKAADHGFTFYTHPEIEFYLLKSSTIGPAGPEPVDAAGYFDNVPGGTAHDFRRRSVRMLEDLGISVEFSHHEAGPGQNEIDLRYADALTTADNVMTFRTVIKEVAIEQGVYATFMPKPMSAHPGSGMHTHMSLFEGDSNAFHSPSGQYQLSTIGRRFIAGLLKHAPEITLVTNQFVNSYKRLWGGDEAPSYVCWGHNNRSALVRVPLYKPGKNQSSRIEYRAIDSAANPYLSFALLLAAGLKGIEEEYELPPEAEDEVWSLSDGERRALGYSPLPASLDHAIRIAEDSELVAETLGEQVFQYVLKNKRREWNAYRSQVTPYELSTNLELL
jgi:glutamine synthetase